MIKHLILSKLCFPPRTVYKVIGAPRQISRCELFLIIVYNFAKGTIFQKALRAAFWGEARKGFGVHWCIYNNERRCPCGHRSKRPVWAFRQISTYIFGNKLPKDPYRRFGMMPAMSSTSNSIATPIKAKALASFDP